MAPDYTPTLSGGGVGKGGGKEKDILSRVWFSYNSHAPTCHFTFIIIFFNFPITETVGINWFKLAASTVGNI